MVLEQIHTPEDVKKLNDTQVKLLCTDLRDFLVHEVSRTGGHLASNLGVVELTVAIHRVFDTSRDRLLFDVGHQCYVHKALTGRRELFSTLRQFGGLSGFPKPHESIHDAFVAGHASSSISVALGMARARTLLHQDHHVIALIGDGALGGGLSFEGLNDAGSSKEPLIILLNDNGMSIEANVGGTARHLKELRNKPGYYRFKKWYRHLMGTGHVGRRLYRFSHGIKTALKKWVLPSASLFEDMGFSYMGPYDGHDVLQLTQALCWAKELHAPVVVHVHTKKGKGYAFAESNPSKFHGIGAFSPDTGELKNAMASTFSKVFGEELTMIAKENECVCAITAAMVDGTGLAAFAQEFPERFFDVGIAEGHAVSLAGGMAKQGLIPIFAVYSSFLQRGYDELLQDVSLDALHVVLAVDRAGLVGADGETHHGIFDIGFLTQIPNMTVLCPASFSEMRSMLRYAVNRCKTAVAVRYPRGGEGHYRDCCGDEPFTLLKQGSDGMILAYGTLINNALDASDLLENRNIRVSVVKLNRITALEMDDIISCIGSVKCLLVIEDCMAAGCIGQRITASLAQKGRVPAHILLKNLGDRVPAQGSVAQLQELCELDAQSIADAMEVAIRGQ